MKLLPAMLLVILVFFVGLVFLGMRRSLNMFGLHHLRPADRRKIGRAVTILLLFIVLLLLLKVMGKIALLVTAVLSLIFFLSFKRW